MLALVAVVMCNTLHLVTADAADAGSLLGTMSAQGVLPTAETTEMATTEGAEAGVEEEKSTAALAGDLNMDQGAAGSIGGIPEGVGQTSDEDWAGLDSGAGIVYHSPFFLFPQHIKQ